MAKRKTKKKKKGPSLWRRVLGVFIDEQFAPLRKMVIVGIPVCLLIAGAVVGMSRLEGYVKNVAAVRDIPLTVSYVGDKPLWATDELIKTINFSTGIKSDDYLLDDELVKRVWDRLQNNCWVAQVNAVRKTYSGQIMVDYSLREPIAELVRGNDIRFIDLEGMVMSYVPIQKHLVRIDGSRQSVPVPGTIVKYEDIKAALEILGKIQLVDKSLSGGTEAIWPELASINVANYGGRENEDSSHINLYTNKSTEIRWGVAVGRENAYWEADFPTKITRLYRDYRDYGTLDINSSGIDLRDHKR